VNLRIVEDIEGFRALQDAWTRLLAQAQAPTVFNTWEWQFLWWKHYGDNQPLRIVVVSEGEEIVGILPLYIQTRRVWGRLPVRVARFVATGGDTAPDYLGPILHRDHAEEASSRLATFLSTEFQGWDVMVLTDISQGSAFESAMLRIWAANDQSVEWGISARISYVQLPPSWQDYLATLDSKRRHTMRSGRQKLEAVPGARLFRWDDADTLDQAVDRLIELHHARWRGRADKYAFSSSEYVNFHRELMRVLAQRGWLRLYGVAIGDDVVAMLYCYGFNGTVSYFQGGFDPAYQNLRLGTCLIGYAIERAIAEGGSEFDMLRGEYDYKKQWAKEVRQTQCLTVYGNNPATFVYRVANNYIPRLKTVVKQLVARGRALTQGGMVGRGLA
jgi:CelD/BcsL family acetyltransferase involved in cellulose biosynthesis